MNLHPILRRSATPTLAAGLRWSEPLKLHLAASSWAIAIGKLAGDAGAVKAIRATADELAHAGDAQVLDALASLSIGVPIAADAAPARALFEALAGELFRLLASRGDVEGSLPPPRRERGPDFVGSPLSEAFRRAFGIWLSWDIFDPYSPEQLAWGAAACAADLDRRLDDAARAAEAERLAALIARWDTASLLAIERCALGSWLEADVTEDALAGVLEKISAHLHAPRPSAPPAAGARARVEKLPLGTVDWPMGMSTRFDTPNVQLQAKRRAERLVEDEQPPPTIFVGERLYPNMVAYVVTSTTAEGFGNGAVVERDPFGRPKPGRPVGHVFQLRRARVIFAQETPGRWSTVTYYPTDEGVLQ